MSGEHDAVTDFLFSILGAVPHPEMGTITLFPWAAEDEQTDGLKKLVCEGIAQSLADAGYLARADTTTPSRSIKLACRSCSTVLMTTNVDNSGVANIPAATTISALSKMRTECPHQPLTLDDQRILIQEAVEAQKKGQE